jgi:hypothetical protein
MMRAAVLIYAAAANNSAAETHNPLTDHVKKALNFHLFDLRGNYLWSDRLVWIARAALGESGRGLISLTALLLIIFPLFLAAPREELGHGGARAPRRP